MRSTQLIIIEDDKIIRESLRKFIIAKSTFEIADEFECVEDFLDSDVEPTILLLDIGLPGMSGVDGLPIIKSKFPHLDVIMLTTYEESDIIFKALCAGACSYISKRTPLIKIVEAINIVANGGSYMSPTIAKKVTAFFLEKSNTKKISLTKRQDEIVGYIVKGHSYKEIASLTYTSINTVRTHIKKIYRLLEIGSKIELMQLYVDGKI